MTVQDIFVRRIFDSRGDATVEAGITNKAGNVFTAQVPAGKSTGKHEATSLPFPEAEEAAVEIREALAGRSFDSIASFDDVLRDLDGTENKKRLGGNVLLGLSVSMARALASERGREVWQILREEFFAGTETHPPRVFANLINGGAHAGNDIDIQEYMVIVPTTAGAGTATERLVAFYRRLGGELRRERNVHQLPVGDEGEYAVSFDNNRAPLTALNNLIGDEDNEWELGVDAAATGFSGDGEYVFDGAETSTADLNDIYLAYMQELPRFISLEDPFAETDIEGFARLMKHTASDVWVIGDDVTVTDADRIRRMLEREAINAVIIKPNQTGTVSESCYAMRAAAEGGAARVVSHRSGETEDPFIISLAKAGGAEGVKIGAPARERLIKYNELIRLYDS